MGAERATIRLSVSVPASQSYGYAFNRADPSDIKLAQEALEATNAAVLEMGGIPWKAEAPAQKQIIESLTHTGLK